MPVAASSAPPRMSPLSHRLLENRGLAFRGDEKRGQFELLETEAWRLLTARNRHGKPNSDVVRPWAGARDILGESRRRWIIDFPPDLDEREAALYELPFAWVRRHARPAGSRRQAWWIHGGPQRQMRIALAKRERFIATPAAGRHRAFVWLPPDLLPDHSLVVFARDDDYFFGVLHSRWHDAWTRWSAPPSPAMTRTMRYAPATCFESFPFPWPPATPLGKLTRTQEEQRSAIAQTARALDAQRCEWLGDRAEKKRTLIALYKTQPAWLVNAHAALDDAVAAAYGGSADLPEDDLVQRLLALNQERAASS